MKIDIKKFIPAIVIPRTGQPAKIEVSESKTYYILKFNNRKFSLPKKVDLDDNDFIAIGLYLAEGTKYVNLGNKIHHDGEVCLVNNDLKSIAIFLDFLEKFGIFRKDVSWKIGLNINFEKTTSKERLFSYWVNNLNLSSKKARPKWLYFTGAVGGQIDRGVSKSGCLHVYYASTLFRNFFLNLIHEIYEICIKKELKKELSLILKGFFAGDGGVHYCEKTGRRLIDFFNNDLVLLNKIRKSLVILGLKNIKETFPERTKVNSKSLRIYNFNDFKILQKYDIPNLISYKKDTFSKLMAHYK